MKVGDRVIMTRKALNEFHTLYITGVVTRVEGCTLWITRDWYQGHENHQWHKSWWRKMNKIDMEYAY